MEIHPVKAFLDNYIWMIHHNAGVYCVDPGDARPVLDYLTGCQLPLSGIFITHHHTDHIGGVAALQMHYPDAVVYAPRQAAELIVGTHRVDASSNDLPCGFTVWEIPGHTASHVAYYQRKEGVLLCGDTLFSAGCGRVFDGTLEALFYSIQKLRALPENTRVYCAHEYTRANLVFSVYVEPDNQEAYRYMMHLNATPDMISLPSTIGLEKKINPFMRCDSPTLADRVARILGKQPDAFEVFQHLRLEKDAW